MKIQKEPGTQICLDGNGDTCLMFGDYFVSYGKTPVVEVITTEVGHGVGFRFRECSKEFGEKIMKMIEDEVKKIDDGYIERMVEVSNDKDK